MLILDVKLDLLKLLYSSGKLDENLKSTSSEIGISVYTFLGLYKYFNLWVFFLFFILFTNIFYFVNLPF